MATRHSEEPTIPTEQPLLKKNYDLPSLTIFGRLEALTRNPGGTPVDGFGGSAPII